MDKFNELLKTLNDAQIVQNHIDCTEDIPEDICNKYFENKYYVVTDGLYVDKHRHYETTICVLKIFDKLLGIQHISNMYSEMSSVSDIYFTLKFFEMEEIQSVTYKIK